MCYNNLNRNFPPTPEVSVKSSCNLPRSYRTTFQGRLRFPALLAGVGSLLLVASLQAQDNGLTARQVYYKPQTATKADQNTDPGKKTDKGTGSKSTTGGKKTTKSGDTSTTGNGHTVKVERPPLGLKYVIEQVQPSGGTIQVDPEKVFTSGDGIRLSIEVNTDAYVYLITQGSSGRWEVLFPRAGEDNHLKAYQKVQVPAPPADPIVFEEPSGSETLYIRVSRTEIRDPDKLLPDKSGENPKLMAGVPKSQIDEMFRKERMEARDLTRGKVHPSDNPNPDDKNEWAFYVVNVSTKPDAEVIQQFKLRHK